MEAQIAFRTLLGRLQEITLVTDSMTWRGNTGLRGLSELPVYFSTRRLN
jgi:cytochrome P450